MCYRHSEKRLPDIARELGVEGIVEGGVLREGGRIWVSAQLIHAATDRHLWADRFDGSASDLFSLLNQAAERIADAIRVALTPDERRRFARRPAVNPEAQEANLRGRYHAERWTAADLDRAAEWFEEATRRDLAFAEPWAGLAYVSILRASAFGGDLSAAQQRALTTRARTAIERSLALDPNAADAYSTQALVALLHDWDWAAASAALQHALSLDPSCSLAHFHRALLVATALDRETTYREATVGIGLDPLNLKLRTEHAEYAYWLCDYDSIGRPRTPGARLRPGVPARAFPDRPRAGASGRDSRGDRKLREGWHARRDRGSRGKVDAGRRRRGRIPPVVAAGGSERARRAAARRRRAGAAAGVVQRPSPRAAGHADEAMAFLEQAFAEHECLLTLLRAQEFWEPLHADSRFADLVRRVGIPDRR